MNIVGTSGEKGPHNESLVDTDIDEERKDITIFFFFKRDQRYPGNSVILQ